MDEVRTGRDNPGPTIDPAGRPLPTLAELVTDPPPPARRGDLHKSAAAVFASLHRRSLRLVGGAEQTIAFLYDLAGDDDTPERARRAAGFLAESLEVAAQYVDEDAATLERWFAPAIHGAGDDGDDCTGEAA